MKYSISDWNENNVYTSLQFATKSEHNSTNIKLNQRTIAPCGVERHVHRVWQTL